MDNYKGHEITLVDSLGREHIEAGGSRFTLDNIISFTEWARRNCGGMETFNKLKYKEKETMVLRWKYGLSDTANEELDRTDKHILYITKDMKLEEVNRPGLKFHIESKKEFDKNYFTVKERIGLGKPKESQVSQFVKDTAKNMGVE